MRLEGPGVLGAQSSPAKRLADSRDCAVQLLILRRQKRPWGFQRGRQASRGRCGYTGLEGSKFYSGTIATGSHTWIREHP